LLNNQQIGSPVSCYQLIPQLKKSSPPSSIQSPAAASVSASEPALLVRPVRDRRIRNCYKPRSNSQVFFNFNHFFLLPGFCAAQLLFHHLPSHFQDASNNPTKQV
jgi:hypothetical protein